MKLAGTNTRRFIKINLLGVAIATMLVGTGCKTSTVKSESASLKIIRLKGDARFSIDQEPWKAAQVDDALRTRCLIQTAKNSRLDIELGPNLTPQNPFVVGRSVPNRLVLFENSLLKIDRLADDSSAHSTKLTLRAGVMTGTISLSKSPDIELCTSNVLMHTRDAVFTLKASGESQVFKGFMTVAGLANGQSTNIATGHRFDPNTGAVTKSDPPATICEGRGARFEVQDLEQFFASFEQRRSSIWNVSPKRGY